MRQGREKLDALLNEGRRTRYVRTLQLDRDIGDRIEQIATKEKVGINIIVNQALRRFTDWDSYSSLLSNVVVPRRLLMAMAGHLSEKEILDIGRDLGENWLLETGFALFKNLGLTSVIGVIMLTGKYSGLFVAEHSFRDNAHRLVLHHSAGPKWSKFYEAFLTSGFRKLLGKRAKLEVTVSDNHVFLTVVDSPAAATR